MSVINQMLLDLERRRGLDSESGPALGIKAVASRDAGAHFAWWRLALAVAFVIIALLVVLLLRLMPDAPASRPVAASRPEPAAVAPPAPLVAQPAPAPVPELALASLLRSDSPVLPGTVASPGKTRPQPVSRYPATAPAIKAVREVKHEAMPVEEAKLPVEKAAVSAKKIEASDAAVKHITPRQRAEYLYQQAVSLVQQGKMSEAQESFEAILKIAPEYAAARQALAGVLVGKKQYAQAEQLLRDGLDVGAVLPEYIMTLARIQVERGDGRGALETLQKHLGSAKENAAYQSFLAALLQRQDQHKQAIEHYQIALRLAPTVSSLVGIGISLQAENRLADAQEAFNRAKSSGALNAVLQNFVEQRLSQIQQQLK